MALIKCKNCGKDISTNSENCIHCGYPTTKSEQQTNETEYNEDLEELQQSTTSNTINFNHAKRQKSTKKEFNYFRLTTIIIGLAFIIGGLSLLITGIDYYIPSREFSFYYIKEYVGGDAYNAIIESSIRGGEIAGAMISQALYICSGVITMALGVLIIKKNS